MKKHIYTLILSQFFLISIDLCGSGFDLEAMKTEVNKNLSEISFEDVDDEYHEALEELNDLEAKLQEYLESQGEGQNVESYEFTDEELELIYQESSQQPTNNSIQERMLRREGAAKEKIQQFIDNHPSCKATLKNLISAFINKKREQNKTPWPSLLAFELAQHFKSLKQFDYAYKFYKISYSACEYVEDHIVLALGSLFVEIYNDYVERVNPQSPHRLMFDAIIKAIMFFSYDSGIDYINFGEMRAEKLKRIRDFLVRWPINPKAIYNDRYFKRHELARLIYRRGFVDELMADLNEVLPILKQNREFSDRDNDKNIFKHLDTLGFICIEGRLSGRPQYLLANEKGYLIRVHYNTYQDVWQITLGITLDNPLRFHKNGTFIEAKRQNGHQKTSEHYQSMNNQSHLIFKQENEVLKVVYDGQYFMLIPSSYKIDTKNGVIDYWGVSNKRKWLKIAHKVINEIRKNTQDAIYTKALTYNKNSDPSFFE